MTTATTGVNLVRMTLPAAVRPWAEDADWIDHKVVGAEARSLREFLAGFLSHYPWWVKALYGVRAVFVRLLGMRQPGAPAPLYLTPETVPFAPGSWATIFRVDAATEDDHWIGSATDRHLTARVAIVLEPVGQGARFHVVTLVHHHRWTGPVYLAVIRPFHHLVVDSMIRAGLGR